jgi:hypothetical protein
VQTIAWVPSADSDTAPLRVLPVELWPPIVTGEPLSVQASELIPLGPVAETLTPTGRSLALKYPFWPVGALGALTVTAGGEEMMLTVAVLADPVAAPELPTPSTAVQVITWLALVDTETVPDSVVGVEAWFEIVSVEPLSVQDSEATPTVLVAETFTVTGTCEPLKYPFWPAGGDGAVTVTDGGVEKMLTLAVF